MSEMKIQVEVIQIALAVIGHKRENSKGMM
jgi:hypothetical protein